MKQIIEDTAINKILNGSVRIIEPIQFIFRTGHIIGYSDPVTLRA
mgnify:CR=1